MSNIPDELSYTQSHEWVAKADDGTITVGITDHAQDSLGDLVFAELPEAGDQFALEDVVATIESVKAASDIYAPVSGEITAVNEKLEESPELVNEDPFGQGWLFKMTVDDDSQLADLLNAEGYAQVAEQD